eukprot:gene4701-9318_t
MSPVYCFELTTMTMSFAVPLAETLQRLRQRHRDTPLLNDERLQVCRVHNAILALVIVTRSEQLGLSPKEMLSTSAIWDLTSQLGIHTLSSSLPSSSSGVVATQEE